MANNDVAILILAAGKGTRLKSSLAKVLHRAGGRTLVGRVEARKAGHSLHTQLVSRLLADTSAWTITTDLQACSEAAGKQAAHAILSAVE